MPNANITIILYGKNGQAESELLKCLEVDMAHQKLLSSEVKQINSTLNHWIIINSHRNMNSFSNAVEWIKQIFKIESGFWCDTHEHQYNIDVQY